MPEVTVKAFSELIHTPLYGQLRILNEQKYPRQAPGIFKIQYYRPALSAIRRYYGTGNNLGALRRTRTRSPASGSNSISETTTIERSCRSAMEPKRTAR